MGPPSVIHAARLCVAGSSYALSVSLPAGTTHAEAVEKTKVAFAAQGFGLPKGTLDLNISSILADKGMPLEKTPEYLVLGFCSPKHAFAGLSNEPAIGLLLPCNAAIASTADGVVEVSCIDPYALLGIVGNKDSLREFVDEVRAMIKGALAALEA